MATNYDDFINAGLLSPNAEREAALMGLFALGSQIGNRSAPRLSPTPPPMDLNAVMNVYQNQMNAALRRGAMRKKMQDQEKLRKLFTPQPVNENLARQIAQPAVDRYMAQPIMDDPAGLYTDTDLEQVEQRAMESVLPAARQMTTTPEALQGLPTNLARVIGGIGQVNPELGAKTLANALQSRTGTGSPAAVREFEFYKSLNPEQQRQFLMVKRATQNLNLGNRIVTLDPRTPGGTPLGQRNIDLRPGDEPDVRRRQKRSEQTGTAQGQAVAKTVPGSEAQVKETQRLSALRAKVEGINADRENMIGFIDRALDFLDNTDIPVTGFASYLSETRGTPAYQFAQLIAPIRSFIGFDRLQQMREESPTGGALGQVAVQELRDLQATKGSLAEGQREEQLRETLNDIRAKIVKANKARLKAVQQQLRSAPNNTRGQGASIPANILREARAAIAAGASREEVMRRLQEQGFNIRGVNL